MSDGSNIIPQTLSKQTMKHAIQFNNVESDLPYRDITKSSTNRCNSANWFSYGCMLQPKNDQPIAYWKSIRLSLQGYLLRVYLLEKRESNRGLSKS